MHGGRGKVNGWDCAEMRLSTKRLNSSGFAGSFYLFADLHLGAGTSFSLAEKLEISVLSVFYCVKCETIY